MLSQANNYTTVKSVLTPVSHPTVAGTNVEVCLDSIMDDIQCHAVDVSGIKLLTLLRFKDVTEEEAAQVLTKGTLSQSDFDAVWTYETDQSSPCVSLDAFKSLGGTPIDLESDFTTDSNLIYLVAAGTTKSPGIGTSTMAFLKPSDSSVVDQVDVETGCGLLDFEASLGTPVDAPMNGPWVASWGDVKVDSLGNPTAFNLINELLVGFYPNMTPTQVQDDFFDVEINADPLWKVSVPAATKSMNLEAARDADGNAFDGFDGQGTGSWMVALRCNNCQNPQPLVLSELNPSAP